MFINANSANFNCQPNNNKDIHGTKNHNDNKKNKNSLHLSTCAGAAGKKGKMIKEMKCDCKASLFGYGDGQGAGLMPGVLFQSFYHWGWWGH